MSDSANSRDATGSKRSSTPRALIHKKILERAGEMPEATMAEVAREVSGASTDIVERVLREYGDPAAVESVPEEPTASDGGSAGATGTGDDRTVDDQVEGEPVTDEPAVSSPEELTEKERAVLETVAERPTATQQEVADVLGVSRATVSKRASSIEGFDWQRRAAFVERVFDGEASPARDTGGSSTVDPGTPGRGDARTDGDRAPAVDAATRPDASGDVTGELLSRLDRIEDRLERLESGDARGSSGVIADPNLAHKVVHACMESEHVSEDEELQVVAAVLNGEAGD